MMKQKVELEESQETGNLPNGISWPPECLRREDVESRVEEI